MPYPTLSIPTTGPIYYHPTSSYGSSQAFPFYGTPYHQSLPSYDGAKSNVPTLGPVYQKTFHQLLPLSEHKNSAKSKFKRDVHDGNSVTSYPQYYSSYAKNKPSYDPYPSHQSKYSSNYPTTSYQSNYDSYNYPNSYPSNYVVHVVNHKLYSVYIQEPVDFNDAPEPVYGVSFRIRQFYDCSDPSQNCDELEKSGQLIDCDIPRFR